MKIKGAIPVYINSHGIVWTADVPAHQHNGLALLHADLAQVVRDAYLAGVSSWWCEICGIRGDKIIDGSVNEHLALLSIGEKGNED